MSSAIYDQFRAESITSLTGIACHRDHRGLRDVLLEDGRWKIEDGRLN
jgi:hypothetical protein